MQVQTTKGLLYLESLTVKDIVEMHDNARVVATEWYYGEELVRRDVNVNMLRGVDLSSDQGAI